MNSALYELFILLSFIGSFSLEEAGLLFIGKKNILFCLSSLRKKTNMSEYGKNLEPIKEFIIQANPMVFLVFYFMLYAYGAICDDGYSVIGNNCVENTQCNSTNDDGKCNRCRETYTLVNNYTCVVNPQCKSVNEEGQCIKCADKYVLGTDFLCNSSPYCESINDYGHCNKCVEGYSISIYSADCVYNPQCISFDKYGQCS